MSDTVLSLDLACYLAVHDYVGGVPGVAAVFGWNAKTLQNKLNPTQEGHKLTAREAQSILELTRDARILDAVCAQVPSATWLDHGELESQPCDMAMLDNISTMIARVGELTGKVQSSLADGSVDDKEMAELETTTSRVVQSVFYVLRRAGQFR